jgi:hypothetical protein
VYLLLSFLFKGQNPTKILYNTCSNLYPKADIAHKMLIINVNIFCAISSCSNRTIFWYIIQYTSATASLYSSTHSLLAIRSTRRSGVKFFSPSCYSLDSSFRVPMLVLVGINYSVLLLYIYTVYGIYRVASSIYSIS